MNAKVTDYPTGHDRYAILKARALAALDGGAEDRGDVAPPATGMPRSMASRCAMCGKDMSVRDAQTGDDTCVEHAELADELSSPPPHMVPRPGGGTAAPRKPMTKDTEGGSSAL